MTGPIIRSDKGTPLSATDHDFNMGLLYGGLDVAELLASNALYSVSEVLWVRDGGFRYLVADAEAPDHHLTTAGGVKLYVLPSDGVYNFKAFAPAADGTTDDYAVLRKALDAVFNGQPSSPDTGSGVHPNGPTLFFPDGDYLIGQTVFIKTIVRLLGNASGLAQNRGSARLIFPTDTKGLKFERHNTMDGHRIYNNATVAAFEAYNYDYTAGPGKTVVKAEDPADWVYITGDDALYEVLAGDAETHDLIGLNGVKLSQIDRSVLGASPLTSSDSSSVRGLRMVCRTKGTDPEAHGIHTVSRIVIEDCEAANFSGHGVCIWGTSDDNPHGTLGNTNCVSVRRLKVSSNGRSGVFIRGADSNAGVFEQIDAVSNGAWGVEDRSFLGNTHIGHHTSGNGNSRISYDGNRYVANPDATLAELVASTPGGTDNVAAGEGRVWISQGAGDVAWNWPLWESGQAEGTYKIGGAYLFWGSSNASLALGLYSEGGSQSGLMARRAALVIGGLHGAGVHVGQLVRGSDTNGARRVIANGFESYPDGQTSQVDAVSASLGGNSSNGDVISSQKSGAGGMWRIRWQGNDLRSDFGNADAAHVFRVTGPNTTQQFGTSEAKPAVFWAWGEIAIGTGSGARRQTYLAAAPSTGAWAKGDIVWNNNPSKDGNNMILLGWSCITAGSPGTWEPFYVSTVSPAT